MSDLKRYEFKILVTPGKELKKDGFHCFFEGDTFEGDTLELYQLLKSQIKNLEHVHLVNGLMTNVCVKGEKGCQEWSDYISKLVSFDEKGDILSDQVFYFLVEDGKILPSNQL